MSRLLYLRGNSPRYPLDRRLGGAPEPVWMLWRREKSLDCAGNRTPVVQPVSIPTELSQIPIIIIIIIIIKIIIMRQVYFFKETV
jgi:hypothetical protein